MSLFRPTRERRGADPYYQWKAILFSIGGGIGLAAIATGHDWLILVAVPILAVGVGLRWLGRRNTATDDDEEPGELDDGDQPREENRPSTDRD